MKAMKLPKEVESLLDVVETAGEETLVFTRKKRPIAALVSLRNVDRESLALSTNAQFLRIVETARKEIRAGRSISLDVLEKKYGIASSHKRSARSRKTRRQS